MSLDSEDELASILALEIADIIHDVTLIGSTEVKERVFGLFSDIVNRSEDKDDYFRLQEENTDKLTNLFDELVSNGITAIENQIEGNYHTKSKTMAVVMLYYAGYNPSAILRSGYVDNSGLPFDDDRAFVGEIEENKSPIQSFIELLGMDIYSTAGERTDRFLAHKSILD
jgi:hypothetical protein